jgi:aspartyl-tRNA(Asn)/glutamyl-tRNA(Gln) amidotransferase subunit C
MAHVTKEEVLKIARISALAIESEELDEMVSRLQTVLTYAERVQEVAASDGVSPTYRPENIMRSDVIIPTQAAPLLAQAPATEEHYFVVPKVLGTH